MADVITRFKLETTQYDSALRNAAQQLNEYGSRAMAAGKEFQKFTKDQAEVARSFGNIAVAAKNPKDKVKELVAAFNEAAKAYNALTKEQQQSDWGKGLAESLQTLKVRISDAKKELYDFGNEVKGGGGLTGALDQLAGKFGLNIQQLAGWGAAIGAAKVALDVAKDAFFASEATVDEWGRIMDSNKSLYEGFLTALNTGDISGYISRIDEIVSAARTAYDELDRLGTMQTIQAPQKSAQQTENDRIRQMIQTGHYIAPLDSRKPAPGMKDGQLLTPEQIRTLERQLQNGIKTVVGLIGNEVKQTGKSIDAVYKRQAKELGMSLSEFRKGTSSMAEFDKRMNEARAYQEFEAKKRQAQALATSGHNLTAEQSAILNAENPNKRGAKWATFRVDGDRYNELVQLILQRDQQAAQAYGMQSQAYRAINRAEGITTRSLLGGGSGGGKSGGGGSTTTVVKELNPMQQAQKEISALTEEALTADEGRLEVIRQEIAALQHQVDVYKQIQEYAQGGREKWNIQVGDRKAFETEQRRRFDENTVAPSRLQVMEASVMKEIKAEDIKVDTETLHTLLKDALQNSIDTTSLDLTTIAEQIGEGINVPDETWQAILDKYNELRDQIGEEPITIDFNTGKIAEDGKKADKTWKDAASAVQSVGSAFSQIEDPAAKAMGTVMQAIASIALGYANASAQAGSMGPWVWLAFAATGLATMISAISTIHSQTGFAEGGIVPGNNFSGDNLHTVDYGINSGELILNRSQQSTIASALMDADNARGGYAGTPYVTGEKIVLGINNYARRSGRGELVFSK